MHLPVITCFVKIVLYRPYFLFAKFYPYIVGITNPFCLGREVSVGAL